MTEEQRRIATIKKTVPAVVSIAISKNLAQIEKEIPEELWQFLPFEKHHLNVPDSMIGPHGQIQVGGGSGFLVDPTGIILTNKHVITDSNAEYTVITSDNKKFKAVVMARDPIDDVAILKINGNNLPTISLGDSTKQELGQSVLAIGNALGMFQNTVSTGIISGLARSIKAAPDPKKPVQELRGLIQTDAAINPGNSGGPLINLDGKAIGINAAIVFGAQNLGFAIPINFAKRDLADLREHGRIRRPLLGIRYVTIDENLKEKMGLPVDHGALIMGPKPIAPTIISGSPAAKAKLKEKDVIIECNGEQLTQQHTLQDILEEKGVGDTLKLKIMRGKKIIEKIVTLSERN